jgi:hypothetical protein
MHSILSFIVLVAKILFEWKGMDKSAKFHVAHLVHLPTEIAIPGPPS